MKRTKMTTWIIILILMLSCTLVEASGVKRISIATAGTTGGFYPYGGGVARIINKYISGLEATAEATGGSVENVTLLSEGKSEIAEFMAGVLREAYLGKNRFEGRALTNARGLFSMYPNLWYLVTLKNSPINSYEDLKGMRVSVGSPGSGTEYMAKKVLDAHDISYEEFNVEFLSNAEAVSQLKDGTIDAALFTLAVPASAVIDLSFSKNIKLIPIENNILDKLVELYPDYVKSVIPGGVYKGVDKDTNTVAYWNLVVTTKNFSEDLAYQIVKVVMEHHEELEAIKKQAKYTCLENAYKGMVVPLHPGAIKYYKEQGLSVPNELIP